MINNYSRTAAALALMSLTGSSFADVVATFQPCTVTLIQPAQASFFGAASCMTTTDPLGNINVSLGVIGIGGIDAYTITGYVGFTNFGSASSGEYPTPYTPPYAGQSFSLCSPDGSCTPINGYFTGDPSLNNVFIASDELFLGNFE